MICIVFFMMFFMLSFCGLIVDVRVSNEIKMDGFFSIWNWIEFEILRFVFCVWCVYNVFKVFLILI